jgi:Contractile injection system tube protein
MTNANRNKNTVASGKLEKAKLISDESDTIEFMFNPTELVFQQAVQLNQSAGSRTKSGLSKISFAHPEPCTLTLTNLVFDTYEQGTDVLDYLKKLIKAVRFAEKGNAVGKRPPIYLFTWGDQQYLRCFVKQVTYKLTRFLANGLPVQARVNITLTEIDEPSTQGNNKAVANRNGDSRSNRTTFGR